MRQSRACCFLSVSFSACPMSSASGASANSEGGQFHDATAEDASSAAAVSSSFLGLMEPADSLSEYDQSTLNMLEKEGMDQVLRNTTLESAHSLYNIAMGAQRYEDTLGTKLFLLQALPFIHALVINLFFNYANMKKYDVADKAGPGPALLHASVHYRNTCYDGGQCTQAIAIKRNHVMNER